jgi:Mg-chelatase subunit ChlI
LLSSVAKNHITEYVIKRPAIDARLIIGREAAVWAGEARLRYEWGDVQGAKEFTAKAQQTARPTGCPTTGSDKAKEISRERKPADKDSRDEKAEGSSKKKAKSKEKNDKKTEWMRCVHCPLCDRDGVDARIDYYPKEKKKRITCTACFGHKDYGM